MAVAIKPVGAGAPNNFGRDKVRWSEEIWERIDNAVHEEINRTRVGQKFLPIRPVLSRTTSVPTDSITATAPTLTVDEGNTTRLNEYWVGFSLTPQQVDHETEDLMESGQSTAVTLATRAANLLAQAEDLIIFQGQNAVSASLFTSNPVWNRGAPGDTGLLGLPVAGGGLAAARQVQPVTQTLPGTYPGVYAENTFAAVAEACSTLQQNGQYGPYALVLQTTPYADTFAPLRGTLILTADRIKPLMTAGFYGSGTLPSNPRGSNPLYYGLLVSLGGNSMDLVVGIDATTAFEQTDINGNYCFRVVQRIALRVKDPNSIIRLEFQK